MTLWHIDDFHPLTADLPRPIPWQVVGVMPTIEQSQMLGDAAYDADHAFCYTVSDGPTEIWCPMTSIEGRFAAPDVIAEVVNVMFTALGAHTLTAGDDLIVPLATSDDVHLGDGVFWLGAPVEDPDRTRFHCYASRHLWVLPVRWSSPLGWPDQ